MRMMKLTISCLILMAVSAPMSSGQNIVLFGDSLADDGSGYAEFVKLVLQTNETYPQAPYYEGRFSNGPVWIEVAANQLGVELSDFAAGFATTGAAPSQIPPLQPPFAGLTLPTKVLAPNVFQQLDSLFLATNNTLDADTVYVISIGGGDFLATITQNTTNTAQQTFDNIQRAVSQLYDHGARKFVICGLPILSQLPVFREPEVYGPQNILGLSTVDGRIMDFNNQLQSFVGTIPGTYAGASASYFDLNQAIVTLALNYQAYGLKYIVEPCYVIAPNLTAPGPVVQPVGAGGGQVCSDPDTHILWDQFNPSRVTHEFIGALFVQQLGGPVFGKAPAPAPQSGSAQAPQLPQLPALSPTTNAAAG